MRDGVVTLVRTVPEAGAGALALLGMGALLTRRRRKRQTGKPDHRPVRENGDFLPGGLCLPPAFLHGVQRGFLQGKAVFGK